MRSLLALFALFCGLACASPLAAKDCANAQCGGIIAPECLSRVGAGSLAVGAAAASTCPAQFDQYRSCLADVAARCDVRPAARTTEPEPVPRSAASPPPTGHSVAAVAAADGALFQFILSPAPLSWSAAEQIAAGMGGRLAIADTSDRQPSSPPCSGGGQSFSTAFKSSSQAGITGLGSADFRKQARRSRIRAGCGASTRLKRRRPRWREARGSRKIPTISQARRAFCITFALTRRHVRLGTTRRSTRRCSPTSSKRRTD